LRFIKRSNSGILVVQLGQSADEMCQQYGRLFLSYRIAIVEDDADLRDNYADVFHDQGYEIETFADRSSAEAAFAVALPDLAVIDIGLGREAEGGFALCQWLRQRSQSVPIIFLSARDSDLDIVSGLRMGADDYVTKDMSLPHILARIAALFRRVDVLKTDSIDQGQKEIHCGELRIDEHRFTSTWKGTAVDLTLTEFWMVHALVLNPGHVKKRQQLMQDAHIYVDDLTITSHIKRIRKKFIATDASFECIDTVYGMGYRWKQDQ
jgi:two-component system OmpR family response regulator